MYIPFIQIESVFFEAKYFLLQCVALFAKVEVRGVGSNTNKQSRRTKRN